MLIGELDAVPLVDLQRGPTTYRVFLLPDALQLDLSMTPAPQLRPAGPRFRLVFGETAADDSEAAPPPIRGDLFISTPRTWPGLAAWIVGRVHTTPASRHAHRGDLPC